MKKLIYLFIILLFSSGIFAQTRTITGVVRDAQGQPVSNASVIVRESKLGTSTNANGVFSITINGDAKTLIVSSIGAEPQNIPIGKRNLKCCVFIIILNNRKSVILGAKNSI